MHPWIPIKCHILPDRRVRVFAQHQHTRALRIVPPLSVAPDVLKKLPNYRENPKYITHYQREAGGEVERYAQVGDVVFCGHWRFGEVVQDRQDPARPPSGEPHVQVALRDGPRQWLPLSTLRVLHTNVGEQALTAEDRHLIDTNRLNLRTVAEINQALLLAQPAAHTFLKTVDGPLLTRHIQAAHQEWFGTVFAWGGTLRSEHVVVGREENATTAPEHLARELVELDEFLIDLDGRLRQDAHSPNEPAIWLRMAEFYVRLCLIHPFRDGNGRISRLAIEALLSRSLGQPSRLHWNALSRAGAKTRWAFRAAQHRHDRKILATLLFRAWRKSLLHPRFNGETLPACPPGLRSDICP